ncbi:hypothetical protein [Kitasatospora sp. DSM 101779]|uniref:hypothetical protein n=1 Tax=Kitasatospora sp. DSM 101779 TaxID=2853165 RepID=UPI0021D878BD|nr:hypothetical protein [Kitasatospora sp. DSM 101779]MCU7820101.1 hypothetical protein [Kitasatospora sp. DSM 101779]
MSHADRFQQGLAALAAFAGRGPRPAQGALEVTLADPDGEKSTEVVHVGLGAWLNTAEGTPARRLRRDRILDEAHHAADPSTS